MKFEVDRVRDGAHIIRIVDEDLINVLNVDWFSNWPRAKFDAVKMALLPEEYEAGYKSNK